MKATELRATDLWPVLPLLAYVVLVPTGTFTAFSVAGHDSARLLQLAVLLFAGVAYCVHCLSSPVVGRPASILWSTITVLAIASVVASAMPDMAMRELSLIIGLGAIVLLTADGLAVTGRGPAMVAILVGSVLYALLLALLVMVPMSTGQAMTWQDLAVGYDNYRFFNHVQTVSIPLLALAALGARPRSISSFSAWYALIVFSAFVFCSGARGTAVALMAAVLVAWPALGRARVWPLARALLIAAAAGALLYALVFVFLPQWAGHRFVTSAERSAASLASDSARVQLWRIALEQVQAHPWLGLGPMHYAHVPNPKAAHPHNIYLQVAAEWGMPLLVLLLALAGKALLRFTRAVRVSTSETAGMEGAALWIACVAILFDGFVSGNFVMPVSQMWIALCIAWSWAWMRRHEPVSTGETMRGASGLRVTRLIAVVILGSQLWLVADVWPEAADLKAHLEHVRRDVVQNARTNPRFWSDGWF